LSDIARAAYPDAHVLAASAFSSDMLARVIRQRLR